MDKKKNKKEIDVENRVNALKIGRRMGSLEVLEKIRTYLLALEMEYKKDELNG